MTNSSAVAMTIRAQVGIWPFAEVGARDFSYDDTSLYFTAKPRGRLVLVKITLDPSDTYSVHMAPKNGKHAGEWTQLEEGIYNDMLPEVVRGLGKP